MNQGPGIKLNDDVLMFSKYTVTFTMFSIRV